jgi:hypothetical protein
VPMPMPMPIPIPMPTRATRARLNLESSNFKLLPPLTAISAGGPNPSP